MQKQLLLVLWYFICFSNAIAQDRIEIKLPPPCTTNTTAVDQNIKGIINDYQLLVMPNPTNGNFSIKIEGNEVLGSLSVNIYNLSGNVVYTEKLYCDSPSLIRRYRLSQFRKAVYIIDIKGVGYEAKQKLIIE